ncbi:MAG: response regulator, partial [Desulfovibrionaceae bacterium]|nr:response regulator [Desulfovibrionaceae bacterium]
QQLSEGYHSIERRLHLLHTVCDMVPDLLFVKDTNGVYLLCNEAFTKFVGKPRDEIVGSTDKAIFNLDDATIEKFIADDRKTIEANETNVIEEELTYPDGSKYIVETIKLPFFDKQNNAAGIVGIARDMTERKKAKQEAIEANRAKSFFLAQMSHELRTPLNAILGMGRIAKGCLDDRQKADHAISEILTASSHLLKIINQILDVSAIEFGKFKLSIAPHWLSSLYDEVNAIAMPLCREHNIKYEHSQTGSVDMPLQFDQTRLAQIIINLIGNAVKYTKSGGSVSFSCHVCEETERHVTMTFSVADTGQGMTEEQIRRIFRPFEHSHYSTHLKQGNSGLGLSISQGFVQAMGGEISVTSSLGVGSTFSFTLCLEKHFFIELSDDVEESGSEALPDLHGHRVLVVDDVEINRIVINELLQDAGAVTEEAADGAAALEMFQKSEAGYYSLILMDVQMPVMDGYECASRIRELPSGYAQHVPIVAMTAHAYAEDIEDALQNGMNGHLAKPIEIAELSRVLTMCLHS